MKKKSWSHGEYREIPISQVEPNSYNPWMRILKEGTVFISKGRRYVYWPETRKNYVFADLAWNVVHPNDPVLCGEVVHHEDRATLNDYWWNLRKLSRSDHMKIHSAGKENPFYGKKHSEQAKDKMSVKAFARGSRPSSRKGCWFLKWDIIEAQELKKEGWSWVALGKKYGISGVAVQAAFTRRGYYETKVA